MRSADSRDTLHVAIVEIAAREVPPVILLPLLGVTDMRLVGKEPRNRWRLGDLSVELVQGAANQFADDRPQFAHHLARLAIQLDKIEALLECVFGWMAGHDVSLSWRLARDKDLSRKDISQIWLSIG